MIKDGELVIIPTDTVYGIGCKLFDDEALKRVYEVKKRSFEKKTPILIANIVSIGTIARFNRRDSIIMKKFWPGPLTLILNTTEEFKKITGEDSIALRIPNHSLALQVIEENGPLRITSCNISNQDPIVNPEDIKKTFGNLVENIYIEESYGSSKVSSTIIDLTGTEIKLVRKGDITLEQIEKALNEKK